MPTSIYGVFLCLCLNLLNDPEFMNQFQNIQNFHLRLVDKSPGCSGKEYSPGFCLNPGY